VEGIDPSRLRVRLDNGSEAPVVLIVKGAILGDLRGKTSLRLLEQRVVINNQTSEVPVFPTTWPQYLVRISLDQVKSKSPSQTGNLLDCAALG
jgi:hypothetical protein